MTKQSELNDRWYPDSEASDRYLEKIEEWREASRLLRQKERELVAIEVEMGVESD